MKKIFIKVLHYFENILMLFIWHTEMLAERRHLDINENIASSCNLKGNKVILAPHSDDEWIGCSTIIRSGNCSIYNMDMPGDDTAEIHTTRSNEMNIVADNYNCALTKIMHDKNNSLKKELEHSNPEYIFVPYAIDWHIDHIETMRILLNSINDLPFFESKIVMYQVSLPIKADMVNVASKLTRKEWRVKWNAFLKYYISQSAIPYKRFSFQERVNGKLLDSYAAEVFCVMDANEWIDFFTNNILDETSRKEFKKNLQSITKIRKMIKDYRSETKI